MKTKEKKSSTKTAPQKKNPLTITSLGEKMLDFDYQQQEKPNWWVRVGRGMSFTFLRIPDVPGNQVLDVTVDLDDQGYLFLPGTIIFYGVGPTDVGVRGEVLVPDPSVDESILTWNKEPEQEEQETTNWHVWKTVCDRYRVVRVISKSWCEIQFAQFVACVKTTAIQDRKIKWWESVSTHDTLGKALAAAESRHKRRIRIEGCITNADALINEMLERGLATLPNLNGVVRTEKPIVVKPVKVSTLSSGGVDKYGDALDSKNAKFNAALDETPRKMKDLKERAGLTQTFYNHVKDLMGRGIVVKENGGFRLKKEGEK